MPKTGEADLADAVSDAIAGGRAARWFVVGTVTAFGAPYITATIDGASVANIRRISSWTTPAASDVGVFAVIRGDKSVQYVGIGKLA